MSFSAHLEGFDLHGISRALLGRSPRVGDARASQVDFPARRWITLPETVPVPLLRAVAPDPGSRGSGLWFGTARTRPDVRSACVESPDPTTIGSE